MTKFGFEKAIEMEKELLKFRYENPEAYAKQHHADLEDVIEWNAKKAWGGDAVNIFESFDYVTTNVFGEVITVSATDLRGKSRDAANEEANEADRELNLFCEKLYKQKENKNATTTTC